MATTVKKFKVVTRSTNHNSFGLYGVVLVAADGTAFEVGANSVNLPAKDAVLEVVKQDGRYLWEKFGFEIPRQLAPMPPEAVLQLWGFVETPDEPRKAEDYAVLVMPVEDWSLLSETLAMDAQSGAFEQGLRDSIAAALDRIHEVPADKTQPLLAELDE